jgi:hypothetical protein
MESTSGKLAVSGWTRTFGQGPCSYVDPVRTVSIETFATGRQVEDLQLLVRQLSCDIIGEARGVEGICEM